MSGIQTHNVSGDCIFPTTMWLWPTMAPFRFMSTGQLFMIWIRNKSNNYFLIRWYIIKFKWIDQMLSVVSLNLSFLNYANFLWNKMTIFISPGQISMWGIVITLHEWSIIHRTGLHKSQWNWSINKNLIDSLHLLKYLWTCVIDIACACMD
jgi:hypothetical protein